MPGLCGAPLQGCAIRFVIGSQGVPLGCDGAHPWCSGRGDVRFGGGDEGGDLRRTRPAPSRRTDWAPVADRRGTTGSRRSGGCPDSIHFLEARCPGSWLPFLAASRARRGRTIRQRRANRYGSQIRRRQSPSESPLRAEEVSQFTPLTIRSDNCYQLTIADARMVVHRNRSRERSRR